MRITHMDDAPIRAHFEDHPVHPQVVLRTIGFGTYMAMSVHRAIELRTQIDMALEQAARIKASEFLARGASA
jgi:hypothetical protein